MNNLTTNHFTEAASRYPEATRLVFQGNEIKQTHGNSVLAHIVVGFASSEEQMKDRDIKSSFIETLLKEYPKELVCSAFESTRFHDNHRLDSSMITKVTNYLKNHIKIYQYLKEQEEAYTKKYQPAVVTQNTPPKKSDVLRSYGTFDTSLERTTK